MAKKWTSRKWQQRMSIRLDYNYMMSDYLGREGIDSTDLAGLNDVARSVHEELQQQRAQGKIGFYDLPFDRQTADKVAAFARGAIRRYENVVVLGIGGSALGPRALHSALAGGMWANLAGRRERGKIPRFFFADNIDPVTFSRLLSEADPKQTLFLVITKSGTTAETMSQFLVVRELLSRKVGEKNVPRHLVAITDAQNGRLRNVADKEGLTDFIIPANVGGRFSVLTPVGLVPAALMGIDIHELLAGAAAMEKRCSQEKLAANPAYLAAALLFLADRTRGKRINVMMPYSDALYDSADWFRQIWAESLGKKESASGNEVYAGLTPIKALGVTDQHSQLQLYMEGPRDKTLIFLAVENFAEDVEIPDLYPELPDLFYLGGHSLGELLHAERSATEYALLKAGRPSMTITLPEINAFAIGQLIYLLEVATAFAGRLYNIDPFNQPGVELGKQFTYGLMGRSGYEHMRQALESRKPKSEKYYL